MGGSNNHRNDIRLGFRPADQTTFTDTTQSQTSLLINDDSVINYPESLAPM